jgi:hypothetical protein
MSQFEDSPEDDEDFEVLGDEVADAALDDVPQEFESFGDQSR